MNNLSLGLALSLGATYVSSGPPPSGTWILSTGFWADAGVWLDAENWID